MITMVESICRVDVFEGYRDIMVVLDKPRQKSVQVSWVNETFKLQLVFCGKVICVELLDLGVFQNLGKDAKYTSMLERSIYKRQTGDENGQREAVSNNRILPIEKEIKKRVYVRHSNIAKQSRRSREIQRMN